MQIKVVKPVRLVTSFTLIVVFFAVNLVYEMTVFGHDLDSYKDIWILLIGVYILLWILFAYLRKWIVFSKE